MNNFWKWLLQLVAVSAVIVLMTWIGSFIWCPKGGTPADTTALDALRTEISQLRSQIGSSAAPPAEDERIISQSASSFQKGHKASYNDGRTDGLNKTGVRVLSDEEAESIRKKVIDQHRRTFTPPASPPVQQTPAPTAPAGDTDGTKRISVLAEPVST